MVLFLLTYYAVLSFLTFLLFGVDKWKARNHQWRIPETRLYLLSVLGGAAGAFIGMYLFRHNTQHAKFIWGIPFLLITHTVLLIYLIV